MAFNSFFGGKSIFLFAIERSFVEMNGESEIIPNHRKF